LAIGHGNAHGDDARGLMLFLVIEINQHNLARTARIR